MSNSDSEGRESFTCESIMGPACVSVSNVNVTVTDEQFQAARETFVRAQDAEQSAREAYSRVMRRPQQVRPNAAKAHAVLVEPKIAARSRAQRWLSYTHVAADTARANAALARSRPQLATCGVSPETMASGRAGKAAHTDRYLADMAARARR